MRIENREQFGLGIVQRKYFAADTDGGNPSLRPEEIDHCIVIRCDHPMKEFRGQSGEPSRLHVS